MIALAVSAGLSLNDFYTLDYQEFAEVIEQYYRDRNGILRAMWEQTRAIYCATLTPYLEKKDRDPLKLMPFEWDHEVNDNPDDTPAPKKTMTKDEQRERMKQLVAALGDETI